MEEMRIGEKPIIILKRAEMGPVFYWGTSFAWNEELDHFVKCLPEGNYSVVAFSASNWNHDFSPWEAPAAFGDENFTGGGEEMLRWLAMECVPEVKTILGAESEKQYLIGYSLAGLFALWATYETDIFAGVASCSGSLWFENWDRYVEEKGSVKHPCRIYLSLGGKEEKTKNAMMAQVGNRTRAQEKLLISDKNVEKCILEWNSGGHFADSGKRLAKGIKWLLE